jgi:hypothetical protein
LLVGTSSCKEDLGVTAARVGEKPGILTNLQYEEKPGGALISYDLPTTPDLRYIKATYTLDNGRKMTGKASVYDNRILVEGYADIGEHDIELVAVSVGDIESDPVNLRIRTGKPEYLLLAESFLSDANLYSTFGGLNIQFTNASAANVIIRVFRQPADAGENWSVISETYTKSKEGTIRIRGEQALESNYGVVVRDQWGNVSDTIKRVLTPLAEYELTGAKVYTNMVPASATNLNGDYTINNNNGLGNSTGPMNTSLFDGVEATPYYDTKTQWWGRSAPIPFQFTLDLGRKTQLSRLKMWGRKDNYALLYQATHVKEFELYGSNAPNADGSWDSWTFIGAYEGIRPSGLAFGVNATAEDQDYARQGEDFEVQWDDPDGFRYYRIRVLSTWNGIREQPWANTLTVAIAELKFFGIFLD